MRGKPAAVRGGRGYTWITPAYAGKTLSPPHGGGLHPDHPRVCGENLGQNPIKVRHLGSPPRMRGKLRGHLASVKQNGITPAYAGKTIKKTR